MSQSLVLIDSLSSSCWGKKKKKRERERAGVGGLFSPKDLTHLAGNATRDFHGC
jgi:hypothetical protein